MDGTVLTFDRNTGTGLISGSDGNRYDFAAHNLKGEQQSVSVGAKVDFVISDSDATDVYLVSASTSVESTRIIAAILAFFLGGFGVHKFYLGKTKAGVIMLLLFIFGFILLAIPTMIIGLIAFIEAIIYLVKSNDEFQAQYIDGNKAWF